MKTNLPHLERRLSRHISATRADLPRLESEIEHIRGFAHDALHHRLHNVEVMEQALKRNVSEVFNAPVRPPAPRVRKLRQLCRCIEKETENLHREVDFLSMGSGSTLISLVDGSNQVVERWLKRVAHLLPHNRHKH